MLPSPSSSSLPPPTLDPIGLDLPAPLPLQNRFPIFNVQEFNLIEQVVSSEGPSGHNVEYLLKLAEWMHKAVPDAWDDHLFSIEMEVRRLVAVRGLCLTTLMGEKVEGLMAATSEGLTVSPSATRRGTFTYTCEKKCLKCVKL